MTPLLSLIVFSLMSSPQEALPTGIVAHWALDEGSGERTQDIVSGTEGRLRGAKWTPCGKGYALKFGTEDSGLDCGTVPAVDLTGPLTVEAWVYPERVPSSETGIAGKSFESYALTAYGDGRFYWYVGSGGNKCSAAIPVRKWTHLAGLFDGTSLKLYVNGKLQETRPSQFTEANHDGNFRIGCIARRANETDLTDTFPGQIGVVRVYDRALTDDELKSLHDQERIIYRTPVNPSEGLRLKVFPYFTEQCVFVDVDFGTLAPFAEGDHAEVALYGAGSMEPVRTIAVGAIPETGLAQDLSLDMSGQPQGEFRVQAVFVGADGLRAEGRVAFTYSPLKNLPSPEQQSMPMPPKPLGPIEYEFEVTESGGIQIKVDDTVFPVESMYSFPHGGENGFSNSRLTTCEEKWNVRVDHNGEERASVTGEGAFYSIERKIERFDDHIAVKDTFKNLTNDPMGILINNQADARALEGVEATRLPNPSLFLSGKGIGVGLVALDDVYLEHYETFSSDGVGGIRDSLFALDAGASYTLEWAVYVNRGDYYDFINSVRRDEGLIRTVEGGFAFVDRREPPTEEFVRLRGLKYASIGCLSHAEDDAGISIEGVEFMEYPKECALIGKTFEETKKRFPDSKVMFHVAHSLFATAKPDTLFPDSRTIGADGKQTDYGDGSISYYLNYFSKERVDEGYRWFIFYPTRENAFGVYMAKAIDYMVDSMGATGMFADGFTHGYGGRFTYDRWDGHTAEIDSTTKTIVRKYASVNLVSQDSLLDTVHAIQSRGGVVIANSYPGTRTMNREKILYCIETGGGDKSCEYLYLAPTVIALGNSGSIHGERNVYDDIRAKIEYGALYFFYGEGTLTRPTLASRMYPITVEEFRPGLIRGKERLITTRSGTYAWPGDGAIPRIVRYDGRGMEIEHVFSTRLDREGTRTELTLAEGEAAIMERVPLSGTSEEAVNVLVSDFSSDAVEITLNGHGNVEFSLVNGIFSVSDGKRYAIQTDHTPQEAVAGSDRLLFSVTTHGLQRVRVSAAS